MTDSTVPSESAPEARIPALLQVTLLREIEDRGLTAYLDQKSGDDPRLRVKGAGDRVTPELQERIRAAREDLLSDLARREAFVLQLEMDVDAATAWSGLEMAIAVSIEAQHAGALTKDQVYDISRRAGARSSSIRDARDGLVERQMSKRFLLTTQERLAARNGVPTEQLTSIFRPPGRGGRGAPGDAGACQADND